jgi:hypothetical protein
MNEVAGTEQRQTACAEFALEKLTRVIGRDRARRVYAEVLVSACLSDLRTADDLYAFGQQLSMRGGFEAAVGGLLGVAAVLRGASGAPRPR